jgi:hypothetical protein
MAHPVEHPVAQDSGVVDEDVDAPVCGERRLDDGLRILRFRDRQGRGDRLAALGFDLAGHIIGRSRVATRAVERHTDIDDHHGSPLLGERERDRASDAPPASRDDRNLAGNFSTRHDLPLKPTLARSRTSSPFSRSRLKRIAWDLKLSVRVPGRVSDASA